MDITSNQSILLEPIEFLNLDERIFISLKLEGIHLVKDLVTLTEKNILRMHNIHQRSLDKIKEALDRHNIILGMKLDE